MKKSRIPNIIRVNTPQPANRYGIVLKNLDKAQRRLLVFNRVLAGKADNDQYMQILFDIYGSHKNSEKLKFYYDRTTNEIVKKDELIDSYTTVDWKCALSGKPIKAQFMCFDMANFLDEEYMDALKAPMVDSRILKSTIEFKKYCQKILEDQQKAFMNYSKRNAKPRRPERLD